MLRANGGLIQSFPSHLRLCAAVLMFAFASAVQATPRIEHWVLDNGARVYFVETHDLPMVAMQAVFDAGSTRDPQGKEGLSLLVSGLLNEGSGKLDADAVAERFENLGAQFSAGSDRDMVSTTLRSLSDRALLDPAVDLYAQLLRAPSFPAANLDRERAQALLGLKIASQSPGDVAAKAFYSQLYDRHPYARPPQGTEAGLKAITRDDLQKFHGQYFTGRNAVLALIGDLSRADARVLSERLLGNLPVGDAAAPLPRVDDLVPHVDRAEKMIEHPSSQTHILMGEAGISRNDPDYFPLFVGNYVLGGGGFVSRLTKAVRDERGLSYSVHSYFLPLREPGPFLLGLQTRNDQTREALTVARTVLKTFIVQGPTEAELAAAKRNLSGGFPLRIESNRKILDYLTAIGFYNLPLDYLDRFISRVEAVTADQVRDAFQRRIHPQHMVTVIVGGATN
jgi:zinc protease